MRASTVGSTKHRPHSYRNSIVADDVGAGGQTRSGNVRSKSSGSRNRGDSAEPEHAVWSSTERPASIMEHGRYESRPSSYFPPEVEYTSNHSNLGPTPHKNPVYSHPARASNIYASLPAHERSSGYSNSGDLAVSPSPLGPRTSSPRFYEGPPVSGHSHSHMTSLIPRQPSRTDSHHTSQSSDRSEYSYSQYKPPKPRYRMEQEGRSLVVVPTNRIPASPTSDDGEFASHRFTKQWPPSRYQTELSHEEAEKFVTDGAPRFHGELREIENAKGQYHLFAFAGDEWDDETDVAPFQSDSFGDMSSCPEGRQTDALERPAMGHTFGIYPGTTTLAYYVSGFGSRIKGSEIVARGKVRKLTMLYVLDRLRTLEEGGIEDEDVQDLHNHLYEFLLHDTHRHDYPEAEPSLESQINDLVAALCRPSWVDFSLPQNQIVATFLTNQDPTTSNSFFHQLLLSIELHLRLKARYGSQPVRPVQDLPEKVRWDLVLAQRWLENVQVEPPKKLKSGKGRRGEEKSSVGFKFPNKKNQIDALQNFAWTLKWPNMNEVEYTLTEEEDPNELLEDRSPSCMSWFTGLVLPGMSMPWILMNAVIDCDIDTPPEFKTLSQVEPNIGLQYRGATYWSWQCIVGKVLGAATGVNQIAGWIGPCSASADLERSELAKINQLPAKGNRITPADVRSMTANSDPIGPRQAKYPVTDYVPVQPRAGRPVNSIRIERLNFAASAAKSREACARVDDTGPDTTVSADMLDSSITFAMTVNKRARSWKVSLRHDTPFVAAYPCTNGPHVLFYDYQFRSVRVDELVDIQNWGASGGGSSGLGDSDDESPSGGDVEEVLVVEAFGIHDNEVFARAWCSFWGLPSLTADLSRTCMACAVREAYAALISVVILTDRKSVEVEVEEVDRLMENL